MGKRRKFTSPDKRDRKSQGDSPRPEKPGSKSGPDSENKYERETTGPIRLNKYIANSGLCSRRDADQLIEEGKIKVNGKVVDSMGLKVSSQDVVTYNGKELKQDKLVYVLLNKPKDFITTTDDPQGRRTVMELVKTASNERLFPVGRLDRPTTGLLLITNDGDLAKRLSHPSHKVKKIYHVTLDKPLLKPDFEALQKGVNLEDGIATVDEAVIISSDKMDIGLELHIGRNRIVRRIFEHLHYDVRKLDRVMYANLTKKDLPRGKWRFLTPKEIVRLKHF